ncbi:MAG: hypothetical protein LUE15_01155 [Oscillospiraceae bacterium]|nr:hypothetical protein [Oscillospiraceae bacterium]
MAAGSSELTLNYAFDGVEFQIYRVADSDSSLTEAFRDCTVELPATSISEDWQSAANTLAAYVAQEGVAPTAEAASAGGSVTFAGLEAGFYLVTGDAAGDGIYTYTPSHFLVLVPDGDSITSNVKYDRTDDTGGDSDEPEEPEEPEEPSDDDDDDADDNDV